MFETVINKASILHWHKQTSDLLCLRMKEERQQLNWETDATLCHVNKQGLAWERVSMGVGSGSSQNSFVMKVRGSTSLMPPSRAYFLCQVFSHLCLDESCASSAPSSSLAETWQ